MKPDIMGAVNSASECVNFEFKALDGQVFMSAISAHVAFAYMDLYEAYRARFVSYDPTVEVHENSKVSATLLSTGWRQARQILEPGLSWGP